MDIKGIPKEKAIKRYEVFIRFVLRKSHRYNQKNLARADLLRRNICKNGGTIADAHKAYQRARDYIQEEAKAKTKARFKAEGRKAQQSGGW